MYDLHRHGLAAKEAALRNQGASDEAVAEATAPQPDDPQPLAEEEEAERERLLEEGFKDWTKRWGKRAGRAFRVRVNCGSCGLRGD